MNRISFFLKVEKLFFTDAANCLWLITVGNSR